MQYSTANVNSNVNGYGTSSGSVSGSSYGGYGTVSGSISGSSTVNGYSNGSASTGETTNQPLFAACMQARGYVWTNLAAVQKYESGEQQEHQQELELEAQAASREKQIRELVNRCLDKIPLGTSAEQIKADRDRCTAEAEASLQPKSKQKLVKQCLDKTPLATSADQSTADWNRCNAEAAAALKP